jgi:hypothetical protein
MLRYIAIALLPGVLLSAGCSEQRQWGWCSVLGGAIGAAAGAAAVVVSVNQSAPDVSNLPYPATQREDHHTDEWDIYGGIAAGITGFVLGGLAGHYLCDPVADPPSRKKNNQPS